MSSTFFSSNPNWVLFLSFTISFFSLLFFALLVFLFYLFYSFLRRSPTTPITPTPTTSSKLQKFSYRDIKSATNSFNEANLIGKGGSGTVFRGVLGDGRLIAVKKLDASLVQVELEFRNELHILASVRSNFVVSLFGYCIEKKWRFLVYEFMPNGSLQGSLFGGLKLNWDRRFKIILNIVRALKFLHLECVPPVIHGDIKPGNVLLGSDYRAKISDFGLSTVKTEGQYRISFFSQELGLSTELSDSKRRHLLGISATIAPPDTSLNGVTLHKVDSDLSLQVPSLKNSNNLKTMNPSSFDVDCSIVNEDVPRKDRNLIAGEDWNKFISCDAELSIVNPDNTLIGKDGSGESCKKDYVMEWIRSQILRNPEWDEEKNNSSCPPDLETCTHVDKSENTNLPRFEELMKNCDKESGVEWWKRKRREGVSKKRNLWNLKGKWKKRLELAHPSLDLRFQFQEWYTFCKRNRKSCDMNAEFKLRNDRKDMKTSSEMWSGEFLSREVSSNTSTRGTVCYVAPEHRGCGHLTEKSDIYSLGVLILVIVSGRRPLHILSSPMKFKKANLVSWCKALAHSGNVLELVDGRLKEGYNKEQARLCINLALLCLQKMPELRPDIGDILKILKGEKDLPEKTPEFGLSSSSQRFSRSGRKAKVDLE